MFEAGKDMFGRSGGGDDSSALDMLRSIRLEIKLKNDLFQGGTMKITGLSDYPLDDKSLVLNISPQDMEYINKTNPFSPNMGIWFEQGKNLAIPRNLKATSLNFSAEVDYRIDL
jgi:hypothetical protein